MSNVLFRVNNCISTKKDLNKFFINQGFRLIKNKSLGDEVGIKRVSEFTNDKGLTFDIIWFKNLAYLRIGEWGKGFIEIAFTEIRLASIGNLGHCTFTFSENNKRTFTLSIPEQLKGGLKNRISL